MSIILDHVNYIYGEDTPLSMQALKDIDFQGVFSLETAPDKTLEGESYEDAFVELCAIAKELTKNL